jgi:hypothetical protein
MPTRPSRRPMPLGTDREPTPAPASAAPGNVGPELHPRLEALLHRVQEAERTAVGDQRRPTFRLMRELLAASVRLGVPTQQLAECLGVRRDAVRNRAGGLDGKMSAELIHQLTDLTPAQLDRFSRGELSRARAHPDPADQAPAYLTTDVVRALLKTPCHD